MAVTSIDIAPDHPAYSGHFPGTPVLPGVVLLDATLRALERAGRLSASHWQIASAKFQSAVRPGETLTLEHHASPDGSIRFAIRTPDRAVAGGMLVPSKSLTGQSRGQQS